MGNAYSNASLLVTPNGYRAGRIFSAKPTNGSADLSFSRASTALRRNSAGLWESVANNVPRLNYPVGGGCPSWLFEPQATNIFLSSQVDENLNWFSVGTSKVFNSIQSPISGFLATKLVEDTANSTHIMLAISTGASNATHTISFYAKTSGRNIGFFNNGSGGSVICSYDLTAGTASGSGSPTITDAGNGWWLCTCQFNPSTSAYNVQLRLLDGTNATYLGDGVSGAYVWGTQFELGSVATSPIITAGSAVTRVADVSNTTGLSAVIGQTEGAIFWDINFIADGTEQTINISDGTNFIYLQKYSDNRIYTGIYNGAFVGSIASGVLTSGRKKIAFGYILNSLVLYINGTLIGTDLSSSIPSCDRLNITLNNTGGIEQKNVILYKVKPSNVELSALTTL